jgi:hypothetical protein
MPVEFPAGGVPRYSRLLRRSLELRLRALVRVVDHRGGSALFERHIQRVEHEIGLEVVLHRPADDASAPRVDDDREEQEAA